jgi:hypothetical protein
MLLRSTSRNTPKQATTIAEMRAMRRQISIAPSRLATAVCLTEGSLVNALCDAEIDEFGDVNAPLTSRDETKYSCEKG